MYMLRVYTYMCICVCVCVCAICVCVTHTERKIKTRNRVKERQSRLDNHEWLSMSYLTMLDNNILSVNESLRGKASGNGRKLPF